MKIERLSHKSLAENVAGELVVLLLNGSLKPGSQLPPERELIGKFGISRATLREALKLLEKQDLIESRPNVGWFAREVTGSNLAVAKELSSGNGARNVDREAYSDPPTGPIRVPIGLDKPIRIPNLQKDRLGTFEFISWWDREKVQNAKVMVVGAGALGNEVIKNLALMGVGHIYIVDFDKIEMANLSRSVLFRESDNNRSKAEIAAARAKSVNPQIHVQYLNGDITSKIGLG
ncbi:MAG: ThiF family adenylyltransferase, partial [Chloroflexota bacterium]